MKLDEVNQVLKSKGLTVDPTLDKVRKDLVESTFGEGSWAKYRATAASYIYAICNPQDHWYVGWGDSWTDKLAYAKLWTGQKLARAQCTKIARVKGADFPRLVRFQIQDGEVLNEQVRLEKVLANMNRLEEKQANLRREAARATEMEREARDNARRRRGML